MVKNSKLQSETEEWGRELDEGIMRKLKLELGKVLESDIRLQLESDIRLQLESDIRRQLESDIRRQLESDIRRQLESDIRRQLESDIRRLPSAPKQKLVEIKMGRKRGPIKEPGRTRLKRNIPRLLEICDPDIILPYLFARDVIDETDKEVVKKEERNKNKRAGMGTLLTILLDCGEDSLDTIGDCFRECGYVEALRLLGLPINDGTVIRTAVEIHGSRSTANTNNVIRSQSHIDYKKIISTSSKGVVFKGLELKKRNLDGNVNIKWKQGSFLGMGGTKSQSYTIVHYETFTGGMVPVYIQNTRGYNIPETMVIDDKLQYGMNNGVLFLVLHDKHQMPFQHRFIQSDIQKTLFKGINVMGDLTWIAGDFLRCF